MNQEQTNITTGKQIRHLRTQLGMTQEELAGELNVTRQALSNWERDVNEPDLNMLKKICFLFGVNMDDFAKEVITKMETYEKKEKRQFNKYDMAIGLFYGVGIFLGIGIFFVGGFMTMSGAGWGASLFGGGCFSLVFGLICHKDIVVFVLHFAEIVSQCRLSAHCIDKVKFHCRKLKVCRNKVNTFVVVQNTDRRVIHRFIYDICEFRCKRDTQVVCILPTETSG